jgi:hypothetical protein
MVRMQENLQDMIKNLNADPTVVKETLKATSDPTESKEPIKESEGEEIKLINFYDWFESHNKTITNISRVKADVTKIEAKDNMIFKIPKAGKVAGEMELVSFYNPSTRPILNLPPVYLKIYKNDTFEVLHVFNDEIFIKSYGVKTGLIIVYCANVDGKVVPFERNKVKKNVAAITLKNYEGISDEIKAKLSDAVDSEAIQLLYKQATKVKDVFTTKENTLNWFLKKREEVIDINHLLKIDSVLINVI